MGHKSLAIYAIGILIFSINKFHLFKKDLNKRISEG
jgi:hypothetical protein